MIVEHMKSAICLLFCCLLLVPAAGVMAGETAGNKTTADTPDLGQVKREWADTVEALKGYTAAQRDAAVARAKQTLDAMDTRIEQLESRARQQRDKLTERASETQEATLRTLRTQRNEVAEWYGAMKHSSASAWDTVKQGFINSYGVLSDSFSKAWSEFGDHEDETS
jgi:flagellar motility protein MotE (MotC chaperone)